MKDSKEKEHRISNLKEMIDHVSDEDVNEEENFEDIEEDIELINYLNGRDVILLKAKIYLMISQTA